MYKTLFLTFSLISFDAALAGQCNFKFKPGFYDLHQWEGVKKIRLQKVSARTNTYRGTEWVANRGGKYVLAHTYFWSIPAFKAKDPYTLINSVQIIDGTSTPCAIRLYSTIIGEEYVRPLRTTSDGSVTVVWPESETEITPSEAIEFLE